MAHKTLIGGTAYEISGGKTLADGTAFSIKNGKTLVGGTVYDVGFSRLPRITVDPYSSALYTPAILTINGSTVSGVTKIIFSLPIGTAISCKVGADTGHIGEVILNGETVFTATGKTNFLGVVTYEYIYTVTRDATIIVDCTGTQSNKDRVGKITIIES